MALDYLQREEILGRAPNLKEFGESRFRERAEVTLGSDVQEAWSRYENIICDALALAETAKESAPDKSQ